MLLGQQFEQLHDVALLERRQTLFVVLVRFLFVVDGDAVGGEKARFDQGLAGGLEGVLGRCAQFGGDGIEHRRRHLAGDGALPDQVVKLGLVRRQVFRNLFGRACRGGRADRLMRFLRVLRLGLEVARLVGQGLRSVTPGGDFADFGQRVLREIDRIGTHIGDQADRLAADLRTLVQLLRRAHRALRGEAELAVGVLLQGRGRERRTRRAAALLLVDPGDAQRAACGVFDGLARHCAGTFIDQRELFDLDAVVFEQACAEGLPFLFCARVERPVFLRFERADFFLALADQTQRRRLHAAGRQARRNLAPQQRREIEADEVVERAPRLLGVDQVLRHIAAFFDGTLHLARRDLVEHDALDRLVLEQTLFFQHFLQVPGDSLAFAIGVGCEEQGVGAFQLGDDRVDMLRVLFDDLIFHLEAARHIDCAVLRHEVTHVSVRGQNLVVLAQVFLDRLRLRRRLDDDQILAHRMPVSRADARVGGSAYTGKKGRMASGSNRREARRRVSTPTLGRITRRLSSSNQCRNSPW